MLGDYRSIFYGVSHSSARGSGGSGNGVQSIWGHFRG